MGCMPRPPKPRRIGHPPGALYFKPRGIPLMELEEVALALDELEALRLVDYEGLPFEIAGERMGISRGTIGRLVESGRRRLVDAVLHGRALRVEDTAAERLSGEAPSCCAGEPSRGGRGQRLRRRGEGRGRE